MEKLRKDWPDQYDCEWIFQGLWARIEQYAHKLNQFRHDLNRNYVMEIGAIAGNIAAECDKILKIYPPKTDIGFNIVEIKRHALEVNNSVGEICGAGSRYGADTHQGRMLTEVPYELNIVETFVNEFIEAHEKIISSRKKENSPVEKINEEREDYLGYYEDIDDLERLSPDYYKTKPKKGFFKRLLEKFFG